ncbi:CPBP family intramembrane glutamic endopeptidase [Haloarculaceae archaeon H-GB2-1]|nr:CPBP family intramembrane glutamic endopeptidase [Haloarculaceae archaeon H-GB11]MEA5406190.1 CPBP family intramembrane glutamic endopeptidase [Haloarculaceae archaeon H-GB2-1]
MGDCRRHRRDGGLVDSPPVVSTPGFSLTVAAVLLPTAYMFGPAVANAVTRWLTDEGRAALMLGFDLRRSLRYYLLGWLAPAVLTLLGAAVFFAAFPRYFDPSMAAFADRLAGQAGQRVDPALVVAVQLVAALTLGPVINALFAFGEEFGWRGYLLPKLLPLGARRAVVAHGLVWGVWHWPLIAMGYEYGFGYPGAPWAGPLVFLVFTVSVGTVLAWLTVGSGSVWPATLAHGAVNAVAGIGVAFVHGSPNPLLGPLPIGLVGGLPWLAVAVVLLWRWPTTGAVTTQD